jgi:hypothetical protein
MRQGQHRVLPLGASGRAVIAMTAVRNGKPDEPGKVTDRSEVRPPTDVMAITSLPFTSRNPRNSTDKEGQHVVLSLPPNLP